MEKYLVAKTYTTWEQVGDEFLLDGRSYIKVRNPRNNELKTVRTYSEKEWARYYGDKIASAADPYYKPQKEVLGFKNGYIWIFKGNTYTEKEYLKSIGCVYRRTWGWGLSSELELPETLPEGIEAVKLLWDLVGEGEKLKNDDLINAALESLLYEVTGEFVGEIKERLTLNITIEKVIELDGFYGTSHMYIMTDEANHTFKWTTGSFKPWAAGDELTIRGTVKDHNIYKGTAQTILTRCSEVK